MNVVQSNADGTIAALTDDLSTAQATLAALSATGTQIALVQADSATYQAQQTVSQANNSVTSPPVDSQVTPAAGQNLPLPTNAAGNTSAATPNGFALDAPVTAKALDSAGCPIASVTTFMVTDAKIWVVGKVHNLKKGEVFTAAWAGTITHTDTWTANYNAAVTCVHFYVEPKTLNMGAGDWTVTLSAADAPGGQASFTIADTQPAATSSVGQ